MADSPNAPVATAPSDAPLVFISHDSRDADLAEAFSKLLRSVSSGMLKSFRSSDKRGTEGIEFGDEWYKQLMSKLESASDVVCLLTERSLDRPWLLYEAGVAKGKLDTPVHGVALGVPFSRVSTGPFYQFQNSDDSEDSLTKLMLQLCRRVPGLEPDEEVVKALVQTFKKSCAEVLKRMNTPKKQEKQDPPEEAAVAKVLEEMKLIVRDLPARIEQRVFERPESDRPRRIRRIHPMMFEKMVDMLPRGDNLGLPILIIASMFRDDLPWLYEIGLEAYHATKSATPEVIGEALRQFRDVADFTLRGPLLEDFGVRDKEWYMMAREMPMIINQYMDRFEHPRERPSVRRRPRSSEASIPSNLGGGPP